MAHPNEVPLLTKSGLKLSPEGEVLASEALARGAPYPEAFWHQVGRQRFVPAATPTQGGN